MFMHTEIYKNANMHIISTYKTDQQQHREQKKQNSQSHFLIKLINRSWLEH